MYYLYLNNINKLTSYSVKTAYLYIYLLSAILMCIYLKYCFQLFHMVLPKISIVYCG